MYSSKIKNSPMFTLLKEYVGEYDEKIDDTPTIRVFEVKGYLADDVKRKWSLSKTTQVTMTELVFEFAYSELTLEESFEFTVKAGANSKDFESISECERYFS